MGRTGTPRLSLRQLELLEMVFHGCGGKVCSRFWVPPEGYTVSGSGDVSALHALRDKGLISGVNGGGKYWFKITQAGIRVVTLIDPVEVLAVRYDKYDRQLLAQGLGYAMKYLDSHAPVDSEDAGRKYTALTRLKELRKKVELERRYRRE